MIDFTLRIKKDSYDGYFSNENKYPDTKKKNGIPNI